MKDNMILVQFLKQAGENVITLDVDSMKLTNPAFWSDNAVTPKDIAGVTYTMKQEEKAAKAFIANFGINVPVLKVTADRGKEPVNADSKKALFYTDTIVKDAEGKDITSRIPNADCATQLDNLQKIADYLNAHLETQKSDVRFHMYFSYK